MNFRIETIQLEMGIDVLIVQMLDRHKCSTRPAWLHLHYKPCSSGVIRSPLPLVQVFRKQSKVFLITSYKTGTYCSDLAICQFYCWEDTYKRRLLRIRTRTRTSWRMFLRTAVEHRNGRVSTHGYTPKARATSQLDSSSSSRKQKGLKVWNLFNSSAFFTHLFSQCPSPATNPGFKPGQKKLYKLSDFGCKHLNGG